MIPDLLQNDGFSLQRKGPNEYASPCPACGGDDRFIVFIDSDRFWCRQCEKTGDAIQYLRDFHGMTYQEAAEAAGKPINTPKAPVKINTPKKEQKGSWRVAAGKVIQEAHNRLMADDTTLAWLQNERGITADTARRFGLGWNNKDQWFTRAEFGLEDTGKKMFIPSGLAIPWQNSRIRIRRDNPGGMGRYFTVAGSDMEPMIIGNFYETTAVILESELDAILLAQEAGRRLFIVAMGSAQAKPSEALQEMLLLCPVILVALDTDDAGAKAARWWLSNLHNTFRALSPKQYGKDLTDLFLKGTDLNLWLSVSMELYCDKLLDRKF